MNLYIPKKGKASELLVLILNDFIARHDKEADYARPVKLCYYLLQSITLSKVRSGDV